MTFTDERVFYTPILAREQQDNTSNYLKGTSFIKLRFKFSQVEQMELIFRTGETAIAGEEGKKRKQFVYDLLIYIQFLKLSFVAIYDSK